MKVSWNNVCCIEKCFAEIECFDEVPSDDVWDKDMWDK